VKGLVLAILAVPAVAGATDYDIHSGDDLFGTLSTLVAGDTVTVHAGSYATPGFLQVAWTGTAAAPITIQVAPGDHVVITGTPAQNVINISGSYFVLDGFELTGGSQGIRLMSVDHARLQNLSIHDIGDVGISCNFEPDSCDSIVVFHDEIFNTGNNGGTGEGMYLGCNNAACTLTNSEISDNYVHDTGGSQGDGIEIKEGSYGNVVHDNVIVRSNYPGFTMYGYNGAQPQNQLLRNLVWHSKDSGIQIVGQILVANNLILDSAIDGIDSKPSQDYTPHDVTIVHNTVIGATAGACFHTDNWATETAQVVANNALYCDGGAAINISDGASALAVIGNNIGLGTSTVAFTLGGSLVADFVDSTNANDYPASGSPLVDTGDPANTVSDDFNATPRTDGKPDVGAYERTGDANPGWIPIEGFKPLGGTMQAGDGPQIGDDVDAGSGPTGNSGGGGCCEASGSDAPWPLAALVALAIARRSRRPRPTSHRS
jgi:hypothetical protein